MENSIAGQLYVGVNIYIGCDSLEDKRKQLKLYLRNKGESWEEDKEMSEVVKAK